MMMRNPFLLILALAALLGCLVSGAMAQGTGTPAAGMTGNAEENRGRRLVDVCGKDEGGNRGAKLKKISAPCNEYIEANFGPYSDLIISTVNAIDRQKDRARVEAAHNKHYDRWLSGALIVLAFLTTATAAISRTYRDEKYSVELRNFLGLVPIIVSALVTLGATFNAYYKFDESRSKNAFVADELAKLQTEIGFDLITLVSKPLASGAEYTDIKDERIIDWQTRLETIMSNYRPAKKGGDKQPVQ